MDNTETTTEALSPVAGLFSRDPVNPSICVVDGFGTSLLMKSGRLVVVDGIGQHRRTRTYHRATHGLSRIVLLGTSGIVSLDALEWCRSLKIELVVLDSQGEISFSSQSRVTDDARLRRIQAQSAGSDLGLDIARGLLEEKLLGQAKNLELYFGATEMAETIMDLSSAVLLASTIAEARQLEASAAAIYFQTWAKRDECSPRFLLKDTAKVPPHWFVYVGRRSVLGSANTNRRAERPVNAILNYLYALVEVEATLACHSVGLDPGLGVIHSDLKSRNSFVFDLLEPVRPDVDAFVLEMLASRLFRKSDFNEERDGGCRLLAPLTHELAETLPIWAKALAPRAERMAHSFGRALEGKYVAATTLTKTNSKIASAAVRARKVVATNVAQSDSNSQRPKASRPKKLQICVDCGGEVLSHRHVRCSICIAKDPAQTPAIRSRRGAAIASRKKALKEWEESNGDSAYDPDYFKREILPKLEKVKLSGIMTAAGMSKSYASQVRRGIYTPHVSTWAALANLVMVSE